MKKFAAFFFLFSWVYGYIAQIQFPLIALDVAAGLLLVTNWKTLVRVKSADRVGLLGSFGFLGILLFSWMMSLRLFSVNEAAPGLQYVLRVSVYVLVMFFAKDLLSRAKQWIPVALWMFLIFGLLQYVFLPDSRFLLYSGWDEHYYRLIGTTLDPNYMGAMVGIIGIFGVFEFLKTKSVRALFLPAVSFISLVLTFSRASWLATAAGLLILVARNSQAQKVRPYKVRPFPARWVHALVGVFVVIIVYAAAPKPGGEGVNLWRTASIEERVNSWSESISVWRRHPILGVGFNNYRAVSMKYGVLTDPSSHAANAPSSSWLLLLATVGVLGVLGGLVVLRKPIIRLWHDPLWSAIAAVIGVHAAFNNTLFYVPMLALLAILKASR